MSRPVFSAAWAAAQRIYDSQNSAEKAAQVIGGAVAINIRHPKFPWENTCAVRMSFILNQTGTLVPAVQGKTVSGGDKRNYFYRVSDVITFLRGVWGAPEVVKFPPMGGGALAGKKGVILFEVQGWRDAQGHATLFNGVNCYDHCYFNEPRETYLTSAAHFWTLR